MKKRNIATAMAAAMMFGGVAPVVAHANEPVAKETTDESAKDREINVALANKQEVTTTSNYRDIYNTQFTNTTKDDAIKGGYEVLYQDKAVGDKTPADKDINFIYAKKMDKTTTEATAEAIKLENAQNNIKFLVDKGYYTKTEEESKLYNDGKDLAKATVKTVTLKATKAGIENGRPEKLVYNFYNVPVSLKEEVAINIAWPKDNVIKLEKEVTTSNQVVELNKFVYSLKSNSNNIIVDKSEQGQNLQLDVYKKNKDGKKGEKLNTVTLNNFEAFKDGGYKGYIEIPTQNDFDNQYYTWANTQIVDAMANGVIDASSEFRPEDSVTRAEFAKILMNSIPKVKADATKDSLKITKSFKDINKSDWYYEYVMPLAELGIVSGFDGEFRPNDTITREEAAVMVATAMNGKDGKYSKVDKYNSNTGKHEDDKTSFKDDKTIADWADKAVEVASTTPNDKPVIKGYEDNTFRPQNNITRAETVVMLSRVGNTTIDMK